MWCVLLLFQPSCTSQCVDPAPNSQRSASSSPLTRNSASTPASPRSVRACSALSLPHKHQSFSLRPSLPLTSRRCVYCRVEGERVGGGSPAAVRGHAATARRAGRVHDRALQGRPAQAQQGTPHPRLPSCGFASKTHVWHQPHCHFHTVMSLC